MGSDATAVWRECWEAALEGSRRPQVERAAANPVTHWLVADAPDLVNPEEDEDGIDPEALRDHPDEQLAAGREAFEALVAERDLPRPERAAGYDLLPIHLTAVGRIEGIEFDFADPLADANRLTTIDGATVVVEPDRTTAPAVLTYRCPAGHETTVRQSLWRPWRLSSCGQAGCDNEVIPADRETLARRIVSFGVETRRGRFDCVVTGRYASDEPFSTLRKAASVHMTGIPRLVDDDESLRTVYEVLAVEPASP